MLKPESPWPRHFEQLVIPGATLADLDPRLADRFLLNKLAGVDRLARWRALGLVDIDIDGSMAPSIAGLLLAGRDPQEWLPDARVGFVAFRVPRAAFADDVRLVPSRYVLTSAVLSGTLDRQIPGVCKRVADTMRVEGSRDGGCLQVPQFAVAAVFEAVVGAVVHRDYELTRAVYVLQYDDALEIRSPGGPVYGMDCTRLEHRQSSRNPVLCSLLVRCAVGATEGAVRPTFLLSRGEGVVLLRHRTERRAGPAPTFAMHGGDLVVTIPAATSSEHVGSAP